MDAEIGRIVATFTTIESEFRTLVGELRRSRNEAARINLLPNELLSYIFQLVSTTDPILHRDPYTPIRLSHTSSLWREIALSTPQLWSTINFVGAQPLLAMFLERSKTYPLTVRGRESVYFSGFEDRITSCVPRWQDVTFNLPRPIMETFVRKLPISAPQLRSLTLRSTSSHRPTTTKSWVFNGDTPNLRSLSLISVVFPFDSPIFSNLVQLTLWPGPNAQPQPSLLQLHQIFTSSPWLQLLSLSLNINHDEPGAGNSSCVQKLPPVSLSHLQKMTLNNMAESIVCQITGLIVIPESCFLRCNILDGGMERHPRDLAQTSDDGFSSSFPNHHLIQTLHISGHCGRLRIEGWGEVPLQEKLLDVRYNSTPTFARTVLDRIGSPTMPLTDLRHLAFFNVGQSLFLCADTCSGMLSRLPTITSLSLSGCRLDELIYPLSLPAEDSGLLGEGAWLCPLLAKLILTFPSSWTLADLSTVIDNRQMATDMKLCPIESVEIKGYRGLSKCQNLAELREKVKLVLSGAWNDGSPSIFGCGTQGGAPQDIRTSGLFALDDYEHDEE